MQQLNLAIDTEAVTSPPGVGPRWTPTDITRALRAERRRRQFVLFAISVPLAALVFGVMVGGLVAVVF